MDYLNIAQQIVREHQINTDKAFHETSFIYKNTNERLQDLRDILLHKDKILCVIGSGDQILNSLITKPSKIDAFDISIFPGFFLELKIAAIKSLTREEYIKFFIIGPSYHDEDYYDDLFYNKISPLLPEDEREFWNYLFDYNSWYDIYDSLLFSHEPVIPQYAIEQNLYLQEDYYYQLRESLQTTKINYIHSDLMNLQLDEAYDLIYLSNIVSYVDIEAYQEKIKHLPLTSQGIIITYILGNFQKALEQFHNAKHRELGNGNIGIIINK